MALTKKKPAVAAMAVAETVAEKPVEEKKPAEKKTRKVSSPKSVLKKAVSKESAERVEELYLQAGGSEWNIADCKARVEAAYAAEGRQASGIKKLVIYLKPEEGKAYYVVNDDVNGSIDL